MCYTLTRHAWERIRERGLTNSEIANIMAVVDALTELEAQPAAPERWEPVEDMGWTSMDEDAVCVDHGELLVWLNSYGVGPCSVTLPDDVRLCHRVEVTE